jgi:translation initiation factor 2B subunit (eIF-2B alpha/beta/delta family)
MIRYWGGLMLAMQAANAPVAVVSWDELLKVVPYTIKGFEDTTFKASVFQAVKAAEGDYCRVELIVKQVSDPMMVGVDLIRISCPKKEQP